MQTSTPNARVLIAASCIAALAGCSAETSFFQTEAGAELTATGFGNATVNNALVQTGAVDAKILLAERFNAEVPSMVNFDFDSAVLGPDAQAILRQQANWIRQFPEVRFRVYGHTDAVGTAAYNKRLGLRRAQAAVRYLTSQGISRSRLEAVASFGETRPLVATANRERRNRRTVTEVTGFVKRNPTVLDGKYAEIIYRDYVRSAGEEATVESAIIE